MVQYKNKWKYHKKSVCFFFWGKYSGTVFFLVKKLNKKFPSFYFFTVFFFPLTADIWLDNDTFTGFLRLSHWQKALKGRLGSSNACRYGLILSYLNATETVFQHTNRTKQSVSQTYKQFKMSWITLWQTVSSCQMIQVGESESKTSVESSVLKKTRDTLQFQAPTFGLHVWMNTKADPWLGSVYVATTTAALLCQSCVLRHAVEDSFLGDEVCRSIKLGDLSLVQHQHSERREGRFI